MTDKKSILKQLQQDDILAIIIGGMAMRIYNSPRITHDLDLAVKTIDVDRIINLMYVNRYFLVKEISGENAVLALTSGAAITWVEETKSSALTFIGAGENVDDPLYPLHKIDITTEIDFLFEPAVPIMRLAEKMNRIRLDDLTINVASPVDLLILKEKRKDKTAADYADIAYLKEYLKDKH